MGLRPTILLGDRDGSTATTGGCRAGGRRGKKRGIPVGGGKRRQGRCSGLAPAGPDRGQWSLRARGRLEHGKIYLFGRAGRVDHDRARLV